MSDMSFILLAKPNTGDYYEGNFTFLRPIYPRPNVSPARLLDVVIAGEIVFREDSYDPTTRIRRGRFYRQSHKTAQIQSSRVHHVPYPRPNEIDGGSIGGIFEFQSTYEQNNELNSALIQSRDYHVLIGQSPAETRWRVVDAESLNDGTTLFTLKSLSTFGLLPVLETDNPEVISAAEKVLDAALKFPPVSVVDVCRESTRIILAKKYGEAFSSAKDLGDLIKKLDLELPKNDIIMISSAAKIINRFHSRGKTAEQEKRAYAGKPLRSIMDDDAILAVRLFGFLMTELKFAKTA
jgi:hypothetical protein